MAFSTICRDIEKLGINLYDLALYRDGQIETHRFQPCNNCNNCYSVAKAFMITAVGMLCDDGLLDVKNPLHFYMGDLMPKDVDPAWQLVTVEDVLKHQIGFDEGFLDIDTDDASLFPSRDFLDIVFHHPIVHLPGQHYQYSDAAYYLVSRLCSHVAGERVDELLSRRLFEPLKVREAAWSCCPQHHPIGATGLYLSAADMVKLPALYLEGGVWMGQRIVSESWVQQVIRNEYEFEFKTPAGLIGKGGMYGQMILFSREKRFAAAWHAFTTDGDSMARLIDFFSHLN